MSIRPQVSSRLVGAWSWGVAPIALLCVLSASAMPAAAQSRYVTTVAGNGLSGSGGDGGPATAASLSAPGAVAVNAAGDYFIADTDGLRIRMVSGATGVITTVAGTGVAGSTGDGGPATEATLNYPVGVAVDADGNLYISEYLGHRIRKVTAATGLISTYAGNGTAEFAGDGGPATAASLDGPWGLSINTDGHLFIADYWNHRVRMVTAGSGLIVTVAGTSGGFSGDGGPATAAQLTQPIDVCAGMDGNLYIADYGNFRIRKIVTATGLISTVAGDGSQSFGGDGGQATAAQLNRPYGVAVDPAGNIFVADSYNHRIRYVAAATGVISTIAGTGNGAFGGDGGPALNASFEVPIDVAIAGGSGLYIADYGNMRVRMLTTWQVPSDFDGDRKSDVLWRHAGLGEVWVWPMDGDLRTAETYVRTVSDTNWEIRGQGDLDGDGDPDLVWRNKTTGEVYFWPMTGTTPDAEIYVGTVDPVYDIVGTGDFDGDTKADFLWRHTTLGDVWIWLMDGATSTAEVFIAQVDPAYVVKGVGDLDADTKADIVWHHATLGEVWVWPMDGTTRLDEVYVGSVPDTGYQIQAVADFTGDRKADLVWHHATLGEVWIWTMNGAARDAETWVATIPDTNYRIVGTGDYDGDGTADLLWHHATLGEVWMWLMDATTKLSETWVATVPDTGYRIVK